MSKVETTAKEREYPVPRVAHSPRGGNGCTTRALRPACGLWAQLRVSAFGTKIKLHVRREQRGRSYRQGWCPFGSESWKR